MSAPDVVCSGGLPKGTYWDLAYPFILSREILFLEK